MEEDLQQPLIVSSDRFRDEKRSTLWTVCPYILGNELCERLAFYGLAFNLVSYIKTNMGGQSSSAAIEVSIFGGTCYLTPLLGAVVADSLWGRYKTILVFSSIYLLGLVALTLTSCVPSLLPPGGQEANTYQQAALAVALGIIALGTGGIKPNVSAFGADQFDDSDPQDQREKASFFNFFYLAVNLGSLVASTVIVYIQDNVGWTVGFAIPGIAMLTAICFFVAGSGVYQHVQPKGSPLARVLGVVLAAARNRWQLLWSRRQTGLSLAADGPGGLRNTAKSYAWLEDAIAAVPQAAQGHVSWQRSGVGGYTPKQVEEVKMVLRMLPIFWTTAFYWTVYQQMASMFVQQGFLMATTLQLGSVSFRVPPASMSLFNTVAIIAMIPLYDRLLEPAVRRLGGKITLLRRIGWGMLLSVAAMVVAALTERMRLSHFRDTGRTDLSILWQAPQYLLVGLSEVFASVGQLEFFYDQAPDVMRSCSMAMQLLSNAVGSYLAGLLVLAVSEASSRWAQPWLPADLNYGRMDLFFWLLAALAVVNLAAFLAIAVRYEYKTVEHKLANLRPPSRASTPVGPAGAAVAVGVPHPQQALLAHRVATAEQGEEYSRSLAYYPDSPAIPIPFR